MNRIQMTGSYGDEDRGGKKGSRDARPGQTGTSSLTGFESTTRWHPARRDGSKTRKRPAVFFFRSAMAACSLGVFL
jgi:hypothetical protein